MDREKSPTSFMAVYDSFFARVTDNMYMELSEEDTTEMLQDLLINAIPRFEFPRVNLFDYELGHWEDLGTYKGIESDNKEVPATGQVGGAFTYALTQEEINILAINMVIEWLGQQLDTTENTRMKYSGSDFKFTSQANHMAKIKVLIDAQNKDSIHLQRIYSRRNITDGGVQSSLGKIVTVPSYGATNINRAGTYGGKYGFKV